MPTKVTFVASDVHGFPERIKTLLGVLDSRGWVLDTTPGVPVLHHETERLIIAGDNCNRGKYSAPWSYLVATSQRYRENVIALLGNHEVFLTGWFAKGNVYPGVGMEETINGLFEYPEYANFIEDSIKSYPTTFHGVDYVVAHAYPYAQKFSEYVYGPIDDSGITWERWWETHPSSGTMRIFGHYSMTPEEATGLGNNAVCVDGWADRGKIMTYWDGAPKTYQNDGRSSKLWEDFLKTTVKV